MSSQKQNYHVYYFTIGLLAAGLLYFSVDYPVRRANLYGFVESPKVRLSHPRKTVILEVNVTPGQKVEKGAVLMRLASETILDDLQKLAYREIQLNASAEKERFEFEIQRKELALEEQRASAIRAQEMTTLKTAEERDASWLKNFSETAKNDTITSWKAELIEDAYLAKISEIRLKQSLLIKRSQFQSKAVEASREELANEKRRLEEERASLTLVAPASGIVDNVHFMPGQTAEGFSDLLSLLPDENKFVRGYITDQTVFDGNISDVVIQSALEPRKETTATYVGSGGVEVLPPTIQQSHIQQSGKVVFFKLDNTEGWLQGEKVIILMP